MNPVPQRPDGNIQAIIAKLLYYQDCIEVLGRARNQKRLQFNSQPITISMAQARAVFTQVPKYLLVFLYWYNSALIPFILHWQKSD